MVDGRPPGFRGLLRRLATTLDASDSLIESMVGLVVIIGVTSSSRIGFVDPALGVDAVLIGESLMRADDPGEAIAAFHDCVLSDA